MVLLMSKSMCQDQPKLMLSGSEMLSIYIVSTAIFNQFYLKGANTLEQKEQMEKKEAYTAIVRNKAKEIQAKVQTYLSIHV